MSLVCFHILSGVFAYLFTLGMQTTQIGMCRRASTILTSQSGSKFQHGMIPFSGPILVVVALHLLTSYRCFVFQGSVELAWHNNLYRTFARPASVVAREVRIIHSLRAVFFSLIKVL